MFDTSRIELGPGTLYAAPLGTTEPDSVSGAWGAGWVQLGYTDAGSTFTFQTQTANVEVEEELFAARIVSTGASGTLAFALAELTRQNLLLALNAGITSLAAATTGTSGTDASIWAEPPALGTEKRVMLGWDALPKGADGTGADVLTLGRIVARQCLQTGNISLQRRKGNNKATYGCTFAFEKPSSKQPFRFWFPPQLAA